MLNGTMYISHYYSVPGYSRDYSTLYKIDDLPSSKVSSVFKETNRLISSFYEFEQNFGLGVFLETFQYKHNNRVDGNVYYSDQFGILNKNGEFKPLDERGPRGSKNDFKVEKQSDGNFIVSWPYFDQMIKVKIDSLGNKLDLNL
jgi:hypothetical protein